MTGGFAAFLGTRRAAALAVAVWIAAALARSADRHLLLDDAAHFLMLGKSMASGQGLRYLCEPHAPESSNLHFAYPAVLAAMLRAGVPDQALCASGILLGALFLWTVLRAFGDVFPEGSAPLLALLAGLGLLHDHALLILSDVQGAALALLGLWAVRRYGEEGPLLGRWGLAAVGFLLAAVWTRPATLMALAAGCGWLLLDAPDRKARLKKALLLGMVVAAGWGLWSARWKLRGEELHEYHLRDMAMVDDPLHPERGPLKAATVLGRVRKHALVTFPVDLARIAWIGDPGRRLLPPWGCFAVTGLMALGFALRALGRRSPAEHYAFWTLLTLLIWHNVEARHLLPVAPFLLAYAAHGALRILGRMPRTGRGLLTAFLLAAVSWGVFWRLTRPHAPAEPPRQYVQAVDWVGAHAAPDDLVLGFQLPTLWLRTGLKGLWCPCHWSTRKPADLDAVVRDRSARWLLLNDQEISVDTVRRHLDAHPGAWAERARFGATAVYELAPAR